MRKIVAVLAVILSPSLTACQSAVTATPGMGDAVAHNIAMQVINPDPHPGDEPPPETSGRRIGDAAERYRSGEVTPPVPISTSSIKAAMPSAKR